jgi:hypothetical protein
MEQTRVRDSLQEAQDHNPDPFRIEIPRLQDWVYDIRRCDGG